MSPNPGEGAEKLYDMTAAARALSVSYATILRWMKKGYISYYANPSGRKRIPEREILRIRAQGTHEADDAHDPTL